MMKLFQIMTYAGDKYKQRIEDKTWIAPSKEQQQILAMQAKLEKLEKKKTTTSMKSTSSNTSAVNNGPQRAEWQMVKPTAKEVAANNTKKVNGKVFKWCAKHGFWSKHSTKQCRLPDKKEEEHSKPAAKMKKSGANDKQDTKKAKLIQALASIHEDHEMSEVEEDEDE
jgi:hypothetical protein